MDIKGRRRVEVVLGCEREDEDRVGRNLDGGQAERTGFSFVD